MANKEDTLSETLDLLKAFREAVDQYFLFENHITGEKRVYEGLKGIVLHRNAVKLHGPDSASITRLDPKIGKLLYAKQKEK